MSRLLIKNAAEIITCDAQDRVLEQANLQRRCSSGDLTYTNYCDIFYVFIAANRRPV